MWQITARRKEEGFYKNQNPRESASGGQRSMGRGGGGRSWSLWP